MYLLIKPASGACNLACRYCFYADEMNSRGCAVRGFMTEKSADTIISKAIERASSPEGDGSLSLGFQGGEPMLAGLDFYRHVAGFVRENNPHTIPVFFFLQTNGTLITPEWADFFRSEGFLIGLSLDGVPETHDRNRTDRKGSGTHSSVMKAARILAKHGVDFNVLTVLTQDSARSPEKIYNFYKKNGFYWQQYIPCIAPLGGEDTVFSLSAERYGTFLCRLFDLWYADFEAGKQVYNREFENWAGIIAGRQPEDCGMRGICSPQYLVEADGSVYPCDFYALDAYLLGNLTVDGFDDVDAKRKELGFIEASEVLSDECLGCKWRSLCRGGCRRNRDERGLNRFCGAYKTFFEHAYPRLRNVAEVIARGRGR